jgi:hypothetical protein
MRGGGRLATVIPLPRLWTADGYLPHARRSALYADDVEEMIRGGQARVAVAEVGEPLHWIGAGQLRAFWTHEAEPRLIPPGTPLPPGADYGYTASFWSAEDLPPVILLEVFVPGRGPEAPI